MRRGRWAGLALVGTALLAAAAVVLTAALAGVHADWTPQVRPDQPVGPTADCLAAHRTPCLLPVNVAPPVYLNR